MPNNTLQIYVTWGVPRSQTHVSIAVILFFCIGVFDFQHVSGHVLAALQARDVLTNGNGSIHYYGLVGWDQLDVSNGFCRFWSFQLDV